MLFKLNVKADEHDHCLSSSGFPYFSILRLKFSPLSIWLDWLISNTIFFFCFFFILQNLITSARLISSFSFLQHLHLQIGEQPIDLLKQEQCLDWHPLRQLHPFVLISLPPSLHLYLSKAFLSISLVNWSTLCRMWLTVSCSEFQQPLQLHSIPQTPPDLKQLHESLKQLFLVQLQLVFEWSFGCCVSLTNRSKSNKVVEDSSSILSWFDSWHKSEVIGELEGLKEV